MPQRVAGLTVAAFVICALFAGGVRAVHYGFGVNELGLIILRPAPTAPPALQASAPQVGITGYVTRPNCTLTLYADDMPIATARPSSQPARFAFTLPQSLWETQNQILAQCPLPGFPFVSRSLISVPLPQNHLANRPFPNEATRAVHFWVSPGSTSFYGLLELRGDDPRLTSALGLSSLDQLARQVFNINFNFHPVYDALRSPVVRLYHNNHHNFLTLQGGLYPYATVAGSSKINIVVSPVEPGNSIRPRNGYSKVVVQLRGLTASSFPTDALGVSQPLGPPQQLNPDGSYVWYTSATASSPQSIQIAVRGYTFGSLNDVHHFLTAAAKTVDPFLEMLAAAVHALIGVAIVVILLFYAGFWRHDAAHERYCGIIAAAALASVLVDAGAWLGRYSYYLYLSWTGVQSAEEHRFIVYLLGALRPTFAVAQLAALVSVAAIVLTLRHFKVTHNFRYFLGTAVAIFAISLFGSLYRAVELHYRYVAVNGHNNLNSSMPTIFSDAVLAIVLFVLLMVSFRPDLGAALFRTRATSRSWIYWTAVFVMALSASVTTRSLLNVSPNFAAPEFRIDAAVMEAGNYISSLAVVVPVLWFLCSRNHAMLRTAKHKAQLALAFAVLIILTGYAYLGFPITLVLMVAAIYWIALRANKEYEVISESLESKNTRADLLAEAYDTDMCEAARRTQERFLLQFVNGSLTWEECTKRQAELEAFIRSKQVSVQAGERVHATELAFGMGLETDLLANARQSALISFIPSLVLTFLATQSIIANLSATHVPFFAVFAQTFTSVIGYMAAGLGFGLAYPYIRGKIGTVKALWVLLAISLAILPYEFMSGSRPDYFAQVLRWLIFFGTLGITIDALSAVRWKQRLNIRDLIGMAGIGHFAAVGAVAATIITSLLTAESRDLLQLAIHHVVPAQYALPTPQEPSQ